VAQIQQLWEKKKYLANEKVIFFHGASKDLSFVKLLTLWFLHMITYAYDAYYA